MAKLVVEDQDGRIKNERRSGGTVDSSRDGRTDGVRGVVEILEDEDFVDANREKCINTSRDMYSALASHTNSEASTTVRTVTEWKHGENSMKNYSRTTLGPMFRVQRECMYSKLVKDVSQVRPAIVQWEEKWKAMMSELGGDAKIPDLWRVSALLQICPKIVKEQMTMRQELTSENYENLKA